MADMQHTSDTQLTNIPSNARHFMWNDDYIELLAHKLDLQKVRTLVDIGSGFGYLASLFGLYMKPGSMVYGFNANAVAIRDAQANAEANPFSVHFKFEVADAHELPVEDGQADMAICQHVLSNVPDPAAVIKEMCRVVRPGGRVVAFEPNNMIQSLVIDSLAGNLGLEERLRQVRYQYYYEHGKLLLGDGDDSVGDRLPQLFLEGGLELIEVRLSDKAASLIPPYDTEEKRARANELLTWLDDFKASEDYIRECFLKGGGSESEFAEFKAWELNQNAQIADEIQAGRYLYPGGMLTYIVIGRKPD